MALDEQKQPDPHPENGAAQDSAGGGSPVGVRSQSDTSIQQADVVMQLDHSKIILNSGLAYDDYKSIAQDVFKTSFKEMSALSSMTELIKQSIAEALHADRQEGIFTSASTGRTAPPADIPMERGEIARWYYDLEEHKQYVVQTVALLHGAKTSEIEQLLLELYLPVQRDREQYQASLEAGKVEETREPYHRLYPERLQSSERLYEHTYAQFRSLDGIERVFWQDTNEQGVSAFSSRILLFLAQEANRGSWGLSGKNFLEAAERWTIVSRGDCYWRAARALGVIWRLQDREQLQRLANGWASTSSQRSWRKAASLLDAACAIECEEVQPDGKILPSDSFVGMILQQWVARAHARTNTWVGCAAAYTYGMLGKRFPQYALDGLENLLIFPLADGGSEAEGIPANIFAAAVSNYVALTWAGHLRLVLERLAAHAEEFAHRRRFFPRATTESHTYRLRRQIELEVLFNVFFLLAATSLSSGPRDTNASYSLTASVEESMQIDGLDILFAGALTSHSTGWRKEMIVLLCAALLDNKVSLVCQFLQQWVATLIEQGAPRWEEMRRPLLDFFVALAQTVQSWTDDLRGAGFRNQNAPAAFERHLISWTRLRSPIAEFARNVLVSLTKVEN